MVARAGSREVTFHPYTGSREREREQEVIRGYTAPPPKVSKLPPNSATDWGPRVKIHEPVGTLLTQSTMRSKSQYKEAEWIS